DIQQQSGYDFLYGSKVLKNTAPVTLSVENASINEVLSKMLMDKPLTYVINKKTVTLLPKSKPKSEPEVSASVNKLQNHEVSGTVRDSLGVILAGVTIRVKENSSIGTSSDLNGRYILEVPS